MIPTRKFFAFSAILASAFAARAQTLVVDPGAYYTFTGEQYIGIADENYYEEYYTSAAVNGTLTLTAAQNLEIDRQSDYNSKVSMNIGSTGVFNSIGQTNFYAGKINVYGIFNHTDSVLNIGNSDVKAQLYVQSGGTLNASDIQVLNATYSNLRVEGTVNASGTISVYSNTQGNSGLLVSSGGSVNAKQIAIMGGKAEISSGSTATVEDVYVDKTNGGTLLVQNGGTLNINSSSDLSMLSNANIRGTLNINSGIVSTFGNSGLIMNNATLNIKNGARFYVKDASGTDPSANYTFVAKLGNCAINLQGDAKIDLSFSQGGNDLKISEYSGSGGGYTKLTISAGTQGAIVSDKITFVNSVSGKVGTLVLNTKNIFVGSAGAHNSMIVLGSSAQAELVVNADAKFGKVSYQQNCELVITLGDSGVLVLNGLEQGYNFENTSYARLTINEFDNNRIFFLNMDEVGKMIGTKKPGYTVSIAATLSDGETVLHNADLEMVAGEFDGASGWWLNSPLIPEPAEWAAILGAV
ncbi:MAG: hypothetical protein IJI37_04440 [Opitutales bacterium]|nr:hypothetical protein [Opitutales bacterium]